MSWREDYINQNYLSRKVSQLINDHEDEIEIETVQYYNHFHVIATICSQNKPYKDFIGEGRDRDERNATRKALIDLYQRAYK